MNQSNTPQTEINHLRQKLAEYEAMKETAKRVIEVEDQNQKMFTQMAALKQRMDLAAVLVEELQILERDKGRIAQLKHLLKP